MSKPTNAQRIAVLEDQVFRLTKLMTAVAKVFESASIAIEVSRKDLKNDTKRQ